MRTLKRWPVKPSLPVTSLLLSLAHKHPDTHHSSSIGHSEGGLLSPPCDVAAVLLYLLQQLSHRLAVIGHFAFLQERFQL